MDKLIERWQHAAERARDEQVRVVAIGGEYRATSSSIPLGTYALRHSDEGWTCECIANGEYGAPCKHLWALAEALNLDVLQDMRITWVPAEAEPSLAGASHAA